MRKIRIGNDINIEWAVFRDGSPEDFTGKAVSVRLEDRYGTPFPVTAVREGNVFSISFAGNVQERLGEYTLVLVENDGEEGMATLDHVRAFKLVPHSCMEGEEDDCPNLQTQSIQLESQISLSGRGVEVVQETGPSTEAVMSQKAVTDALSLKQDRIEVDEEAETLIIQ